MVILQQPKKEAVVAEKTENSLQSQLHDLVLQLRQKSEIPSTFFIGFQNALLRE